MRRRRNSGGALARSESAAVVVTAGVCHPPKPPKADRCDRCCRQNDEHEPKRPAITRVWHHALREDCRFLAIRTAPSLLPGRFCRILARLRRRSLFKLRHAIAETRRQAPGGKPPGGLQDGIKPVRRHIEIPSIPGARTLLHCIRRNGWWWLSSQPLRISA